MRLRQLADPERGNPAQREVLVESVIGREEGRDLDQHAECAPQPEEGADAVLSMRGQQAAAPLLTRCSQHVVYAVEIDRGIPVEVKRAVPEPVGTRDRRHAFAVHTVLDHEHVSISRYEAREHAFYGARSGAGQQHGAPGSRLEPLGD